jgi:hypothetical protein
VLELADILDLDIGERPFRASQPRPTPSAIEPSFFEDSLRVRRFSFEIIRTLLFANSLHDG